MPHPEREPRLASIVTWAVLVGSFGLSASTWIALAELAGFDGKWSVGDLTVKLAWLMPTVVDGYLVVALVLWMSPVPPHIAAFARKNTYGSAAIGIMAQSAYHSLLTWSATGLLWRAVMAALVGALPPLFAGLAVHMRALIIRGRNQTAPVVAEVPVAQVKPAPPQVPPTRSIAVPQRVNGWHAEAEQEPRESDIVAPAPAASEEPAALGRTRRYPTSAYPLVEAPKAPEAPAETPAPSVRRPRELTRKLAEDMWAKEPGLTHVEVARRLSISDRQLRYVMNAAT